MNRKTFIGSMVALFLLGGCALSPTAGNQYAQSHSSIQQKMKTLADNNFVWKNNKMKGSVNYVSVEVKKAEDAHKAKDDAGAVKALTKAHAIADAALEQMHNQIHAVPIWEKK